MYRIVITSNFHITCSFRKKSKMAVNYTASTITIFLNVVVSYCWRLNSFLIQKNYTTSKDSTSILHVVLVTGKAKHNDYLKPHINYGEIVRKYHVLLSCYIGLMCICQNCMNAIILHNDNAIIIILINILITGCSFPSMKLQPQSHRCYYYCYLARAVFITEQA